MKKTIEEVVGENVLRFRTDLGWSQTKLGDKSGVSQRVISNIEKGGAASSSTINVIDSICKGLGIPTFLMMTEGLSVDRQKVARMAKVMGAFSSLSDHAQQRILELVEDYQKMDT